MLDIETVKAYIKVDEEDPALELILPAAADYVKGAVGNGVGNIEENPRLNLFAAVVQHMYDSRNLYASDSLKMKQELDRVFQSILLQLQLEKI